MPVTKRPTSSIGLLGNGQSDLRPPPPVPPPLLSLFLPLFPSPAPAGRGRGEVDVSPAREEGAAVSGVARSPEQLLGDAASTASFEDARVSVRERTQDVRAGPDCVTSTSPRPLTHYLFGIPAGRGQSSISTTATPVLSEGALRPSRRSATRLSLSRQPGPEDGEIATRITGGLERQRAPSQDPEQERLSDRIARSVTGSLDGLSTGRPQGPTGSVPHIRRLGREPVFAGLDRTGFVEKPGLGIQGDDPDARLIDPRLMSPANHRIRAHDPKVRKYVLVEQHKGGSGREILERGPRHYARELVGAAPGRSSRTNSSADTRTRPISSSV